MGIAKLVEGSFEKAGASDAAAATGEASPTSGFLYDGHTGGAKLDSRLKSSPPAADASAPEVSSGYGKRTDPIDGSQKFHTGIDVAAQEGSAILAAASGVVRTAGRRGGYGNAVEIDNGRGITTLYGHASAVNVKPGQHVDAGESIALVGHTGRATGSHLHFEVRKDGKPIDPQSALNRWQERADVLIGSKR
jgi:murein DD-endopeptidase MepM/ murein hydrolase activator NlpD